MTKYFFAFILLTTFLRGQTFDGEKDIHGVIKTCIEDSTSFFSADKIVVELKHNENNSSCPNRPKFVIPYDDWPSHVDFDFFKKTFSLSTNKTLNRRPNSDTVETLSHKPLFGTLKYNDKTKMMTLSIKKYNWTKKFKADLNKQDGLFTLTEIKSAK